MDHEKLQALFEDKYKQKLAISFNEWLAGAPETEAEAYSRCQIIDDELKNTYEQWFNGSGEEKDELENYRDRLKIEYDLIEEMFGLELHDK